MAKKLSERAEVILGLIREHTERDDSGGLTRYLAVNGATTFRAYTEVYGQTRKIGTCISGRGDQQVLAALVARGLIKQMDHIGYFCTEDGAVEYERIADRKRGED